MSIRAMMIGGAGATAPGAPTSVSATSNQNTTSTVSFSAPADNGGSAITGFRVTASPGGATFSGASSPISATGLSNGTTYTFTVAAQNAIGFGPESAGATGTPAQILANLTIAYSNAPTGNQRAFGNSVTYSISGQATVGSFFTSTNNPGAGMHYFTLQPGSYSVTAWGAEGSGTFHGRGAQISGNMSIAGSERQMVALVGSPGAGSYAGGGMTALATVGGSGDHTSATAVFVAGGGSGGYSSQGTQNDAGGVNWTSTTRRGTDVTGGFYAGGGGFFNNYTIENNNNEQGLQHFVQGGLGGYGGGCGSDAGGFGSGGGSCPAGGGGFVGGLPGGNSPESRGGGGGTSYRLTTGNVTIPSWSDIGFNGSSNGNPGNAGGRLVIVQNS
jgi:hypothetical protein